MCRLLAELNKYLLTNLSESNASNMPCFHHPWFQKSHTPLY